MRAVRILSEADVPADIQRARVVPARGRHRWSAPDDALLEELWGRFSDRTVAVRLGRTAEACRLRAFRRGLRRRDAFLTVLDVARIMGVAASTVIRWMAAGDLPARRSQVRRGHRPYWQVAEEDVTRFVRAAPHLYERTRIESGTYWRNVADAEQRRDPLLLVPQVADLLGINIDITKRHLRTGRLAGVKRPTPTYHGTWLVRRSEAVRFRAELDAQDARRAG